MDSVTRVINGKEYRVGSYANLSGRKLDGADLSGLVMYGARFRHTDLRGADLSYSHLVDAKFPYADLRGANLGAYMLAADLSFADLRGADLRFAALYYANFCGADLRKAKVKISQLDSVRGLNEARLGWRLRLRIKIWCAWTGRNLHSKI